LNPGSHRAWRPRFWSPRLFRAPSLRRLCGWHSSAHGSFVDRPEVASSLVRRHLVGDDASAAELGGAHRSGHRCSGSDGHATPGSSPRECEKGPSVVSSSSGLLAGHQGPTRPGVDDGENEKASARDGLCRDRRCSPGPPTSTAKHLESKRLDRPELLRRLGKLVALYTTDADQL
jgi:hypothetical protein